ncbi:unnamed protein product [Darwinula stevensoni]|uniref:Potassium channel domain-containing protein n=1 Tax=Darwinula stevensoni TaxID=69355 RepID=A0A7R9AHH0_9CRUS|nr:unnamed protein product [Darwinula stevensoni]CAG0905689.1 unnamed protein product [Darwinula stevensoni]
MKKDLLKKYNISDDEFKFIEETIMEAFPHHAGPQWKFAGAFYFATVVMAMIGYGHSTPATVAGKAFCMLYAIVGIPLGLVMFQSIGERLNKVASILIKKLKTVLRFNNTDATEVNLLLATGVLSSLIITVGAAMFSQYEQWNYFDSLYYCYITLTTIGFGDFVALQSGKALQEKPGYVAMSLVFILFGLAVVAASMNLLVLRFMMLNMEDTKRDEEMFPASQHVVTLEEELGMKRLSYSTALGSIYDDQPSVCSCTCYGRHSHKDAFQLDERKAVYQSTVSVSTTDVLDDHSFFPSKDTDIYATFDDPYAYYAIKRASI